MSLWRLGGRRHHRQWPLLLMALGLFLPAVIAAQGPPRVVISPASTTASAMVAVRAVLTEKPFDELLRNGFPARLHIRAELWTVGRWFDDVFARDEWDVIVRYDLVDRSYDVARITSNRISPLGNYAEFEDARAASELAYTPNLATPKPGRRGYMVVQADVQTLDMSDLQEVQRWLRGEARPAVQGKRNPGNALGAGMRTVVTRLLGGQIRHLEARSPTIVF